MPQKSWAVGEEVLAADFNAYVQNQAVPQFTTTAQRDAQWAAPPNGAFCVTVDTGTVWQRFTGLWYKPYGVLHRGALAGSVSGIGTGGTDLTVSPAIAVPANRRVRIVTHYYMTGTGTFAAIGTKVAGVNTGYAVIAGTIPGGGLLVTGEMSLTPTAGTPTFGTYGIILGSGTMSVDNSQPGWFEVRDAGAA